MCVIYSDVNEHAKGYKFKTITEVAKIKKAGMITFTVFCIFMSTVSLTSQWHMKSQLQQWPGEINLS